MRCLRNITLFFAALIILTGCRYDKYEEEFPAEPEIRLKWNKAYAGETQAQVETGLLWCFHFLGAETPKGSLKDALRWDGPQIIRFFPSKLGFSKDALKNISVLIDQLKASEEYRKTSFIDLGRFVMLSFNASQHYYKITGLPETLAEFRKDRTFDTIKAAFLTSSISPGQRLVELGKHASFTLKNTAFIASEGHGKLDSGTFVPEEFEVLDLMNNGHFRYGIYDKNGKLIPAVNPSLSLAGKPAKCLWCHESTLQPSFVNPTPIAGYYSPDSFKSILSLLLKNVDTYRNSLNSDLDFSKKQDHTQLELLYISFSEPSAARLASEWGVSETEVKEKLKNLSTHSHSEFPFLGILYDRDDVDMAAPWTVVRVPTSAREGSGYEPDLIP